MARSGVGRNVLWLAVTMAGTMAASFLYGLLVARYLGPAEFGRFALVVGVGGWLVTLAQGGGSNALLLLSAQEQGRPGALLWPGLVMQLGLGLASLLVGLVAVLFLSRDSALLWPSLLFGVANIFNLAISVPVAIFGGQNRMQWRLVLMAAVVGVAALMLLVIRLDLGLAAAVGANTVAQALVLVGVAPFVFRVLGRGTRRWDKALVGRLWRASIALWVVTLFQAFHWRTDLLMVQTLAGSYQVGLYAAANKLIDNLRLIPLLLVLAVMPDLAREGAAATERFRSLVTGALRAMLLVVFPLCAALLLSSSLIIRLVYSPEYAPSAAILRISALALLSVFPQWVCYSALVSLGKGRALVYAYVASIATEIALDLALVPAYGGRGAATGYVVGELITLAVSGYALRQVMGGLLARRWARSLAPGALVLALAWFAPAGVNWLLWLALIGLVYGGGVLLCQAVTPADLRLINRRSRSLQVAAGGDQL